MIKETRLKEKNRIGNAKTRMAVYIYIYIYRILSFRKQKSKITKFRM